MAFALTSFFADGVRYSGPGPVYAEQAYVFTVTGTTADIDFDLGDYAGTFWTAAVANTTYGTMATQVLQQLQRLDGNIQAVKGVYTQQIDGSAALLRAAAAGAGVYALAIDSTSFLPIYTFNTAEGLTAYTVIVTFQLKPNFLPTNLSYNVQV